MSRALSKKTWPPGTIFHYLVKDDKAWAALCGPGAIGVLTSGVDAQEMSPSSDNPQGTIQMKPNLTSLFAATNVVRNTDPHPGLRKYAQKKIKKLEKEKKDVGRHIRAAKLKFLKACWDMGDELIRMKSVCKTEQEFLDTIADLKNPPTPSTAYEFMDLSKNRRHMLNDDEIQALMRKYDKDVGFSLFHGDGEQRRFVIEVLSDEQGRGQLFDGAVLGSVKTKDEIRRNSDR